VNIFCPDLLEPLEEEEEEEEGELDQV